MTVIYGKYTSANVNVIIATFAGGIICYIHMILRKNKVNSKRQKISVDNG